MSAADYGRRLGALTAERRLAITAGLGSNATFMADLDGEIDAVRATYVGLAVTEIAQLRAALDAPNRG